MRKFFTLFLILFCLGMGAYVFLQWKDMMGPSHKEVPQSGTAMDVSVAEALPAGLQKVRGNLPQNNPGNQNAPQNPPQNVKPQGAVRPMDFFTAPPAQETFAGQYGPPRFNPSELGVINFRPVGLTGSDYLNNIAVTFSAPMVPVGQIKQVESKDLGIKITPPIKGNFRWQGTTTITFAASEQLKSCTRYTVTVPRGVASVDGKTLSNDVSFQFETTHPYANCQPYDGQTHIQLKQPITVNFSHLIDAREVSEFIGVFSTPSSSPHVYSPVTIGFSQEPKTQRLTIYPLQDLPKDSVIWIKMRHGWKTLVGDVACRNNFSSHFRTYGPLKYQSFQCYYTNHSSMIPGDTLYFYFNNPIDARSVRSALAMQPSPANFNSVYTSGNVVYFPANLFKFGEHHTVTISGNLTDAFGQKLGNPVTQKIYMFDHDPSLSVSPSGGRTLLHSPRHIQITTTNVPKVHLSVARADAQRIFSPQEKICSHSTEDIFGLNRGDQKTFVISPNPTRNETHQDYFSLDEVLKGKPGMLYVTANTDALRFHYDTHKTLSSHNRYILSDLGITARYGAEYLLIFVSSMKTGKPVSGASLILRNESGSIVWSGSSDKNGVALAPAKRKLPELGVEPALFVRHGEDLNYLHLRGGSRDGWISGYSRYSSLPSYQPFLAYLYSDRGVYQPGDNVDLSGILRRENEISVEKIEAQGIEASLRVTDARGKEIYSKTTTITEFDTFSARVAIPKDGSVGTYTAHLSVPGKGSASHTFQVQEYRSNEFEVSVSPQVPYFVEGKSVTVAVSGKYLFGAPMSECDVKWNIQCVSHEPQKPSLTGYQIGGAPLSHSGYAYGESSGKLDKDGKLTILLHPQPVQHQLPPQTVDYEEEEDMPRKRPPVKLLPVKPIPDPIKQPVPVPEPKDKVSPNPPGIVFNGAPGVYRISVEVTGSNRQVVNASGSFTIHPDDRYLGVSLGQTVLEEGDVLPISVVALDPQGNLVAGVPITVTAVHTFKERHTQGHWLDKTNVLSKKEVVSGEKPISSEIRLPAGGAYQVTLQATSPLKKQLSCSAQAYAVGADPTLAAQFQNLELQPDKAEYAPDDTARILIKSPYMRASGILCFERNDLISHVPLTNIGPAYLVKFKIEEKMIPNLSAYLFLIRGAQDGGERGIPEFRSARCDIKIDPVGKRLNVQMSTDSPVYAPEEEVKVTLYVKNQKGQPVYSQVALMVVDEGVLSLTGFSTPDPLFAFIRPRSSWMATQEYLQEHVWLYALPIPQEKPKPKPDPDPVKPQENARVQSDDMDGDVHQEKPSALASKKDFAPSKSKAPSVAPAPAMAEKEEAMPMQEGAGRKMASREMSKQEIAQRIDTIQIRKVFATSTYFNPGVVTDRSGKVSVSFKLPQNLTTFRIMAVAVDSMDLFGSSQTKITVRKPLTMMVSLPRFAHVGDRFKAGVTVTNQTGKEGEIVCNVKVENVELTGDTIQRIRLADGATAEVAYSFKAIKAGDAKFTFAAFLEKDQDGVVETIPVKVPACTETFATYGVVREEPVQEAILPGGKVYPNIGGLDVGFSSTAMTNLQDGISYLLTYPYGCIEQTSSRLFPLIGLHDLVREFKIEGLSDEEIRIRIDAGVKRICSMQQYSGGFSYWPGSRKVNPWASAYAMFVLLQVREADHPVPPEVITKGIHYLSGQIRSRSNDVYKLSTDSMALLCLAMGKHPNIRSMERLLQKKEELPVFAKAFLAYAYAIGHPSYKNRAELLLQDIMNQGVEEAEDIHFKEKWEYGLESLMHTNIRSDAIVLWMLTRLSPNHPLLPKMARGLMKARVKGRWSNTQENAWALLALSKYLQTVEKAVPNFKATIKLNEKPLIQQKFEGRSTASFSHKIGIDELIDASQGKQMPLTLIKDGPGILYYRLALTYAPASLDLPPLERGMVVTREYQVLRGEQIKDEEVLHYKMGTYVKVRVTLRVPKSRFFLALDDPIPAGFEPVIASFATAEKFSVAYASFDHTEQRKDRALAFSDRIDAGTYVYEHVIRATTPGTFSLPPTKAEEMYRPEVFGRSQSQMVIISK